MWRDHQRSFQRGEVADKRNDDSCETMVLTVPESCASLKYPYVVEIRRMASYTRTEVQHIRVIRNKSADASRLRKVGVRCIFPSLFFFVFHCLHSFESVWMAKRKHPVHLTLPPSAHYELFLHYCVPLSGWWIMWFMAEINSYRNHCTRPATRTRNAARRCTKWMKLVSWEPSLISEPRLISPKRLKFEEFEALPENTDHISGRRNVEMESCGRWNITKWQCRWGINDSGEAKNLITIQV